MHGSLSQPCAEGGDARRMTRCSVRELRGPIRRRAPSLRSGDGVVARAAAVTRPVSGATHYRIRAAFSGGSSRRSGTCNREGDYRLTLTMAHPMSDTRPTETRATPLSQPSGRSILLVDPDPVSRDGVRRLLEREGHRVLAASRAADALDIQGRERVQLIVVDDALDELSSPELVRRLRER